MLKAPEAKSGGASPAETVPRLNLSPFLALHEEFDRMMSSFAPALAGWAPGALRNGAIGLRVDIEETDGELRIVADIPGVDRKDIQITLDGDILTLRAEKAAQKEMSGKTWRLKERSYGLFERAIKVPLGIDPERISADYENGVLSISLPKPAGASTGGKRIELKRKKS